MPLGRRFCATAAGVRGVRRQSDANAAEAREVMRRGVELSGT